MLLEPVTSITDLILSLLALGLQGGMYLRFRRTRALREAWWVGSFGALALATLLGALVHGFPLGALRPLTWLAIWSTVALSGACFVLAAVFAAVGEREGRQLAPVVLVFLGGLFWLTYLVADRLIVYEAVCLTSGTLLYLYRYLSGGQVRLLAAPLGLLVLAVGAALHLAGASFTTIWHFNQNDIFHLALMVALPWYYLAADPALLPPEAARRPWLPINLPTVPLRHLGNHADKE
ncbi:MAG: hypothetical protein HY689_14665 [Chloroflexi bacterium]|nr:hypothetical protein [Chloroflexota bacterium]